MQRRDYLMRGLGLLSAVLLLWLAYTQYQFRAYRAQVIDRHTHMLRNAIVGVVSDLHMAEHRLNERGEPDKYWNTTAIANIQKANEADMYYGQVTGQRLFPFAMTGSMTNELSRVTFSDWGPEEEKAFRDLVADWQMIYFEIYTEEVLQRGDKAELAEGYRRLEASLRTRMMGR